LSVHHREFDKEFQTEIKINGKQLSLNYFIQETLANTIIGFLKTLKEVHETEKIIEIKIEKMKEIKKVDAHTYP
jgi:translation initiation factor 2 beta subunit (eIF-2beta)/eIF-5